MRQNKTIHTPIERGLVTAIRFSRIVIGFLLGLFIVYTTSTYFFISIGEINLSYPFMSLNNPVFAVLTTLIGVFVTILCLALVFLTLLSDPYEVDATIVILLGFVGIGFGMSVIRAMLPLAAEFVLENMYFMQVLLRENSRFWPLL